MTRLHLLLDSLVFRFPICIITDPGTAPSKKKHKQPFGFSEFGWKHGSTLCFIQVLHPKSCSRSSVSPNFSSFANLLRSLSLARPTKKIQIAVTDSVSVVNFRVVRGELSIETDAASIAHPPELELCRT